MVRITSAPHDRDVRPARSTVFARLLRRLADVVIALVTWTAAAAGVLWFYDWVDRWYVVAGVLVVTVGGAMVADHARGAKPVAVPAVLPLQREPLAVEAASETAPSWLASSA
jgi:hypothetical protein